MLSRAYVERVRSLARERATSDFRRAGAKPSLVLAAIDALLDALLLDGAPSLVRLERGYDRYSDALEFAVHITTLLSDAEPRAGPSARALMEREMGKRARLAPPTRILVLVVGSAHTTRLHREALETGGVRVCSRACTTHAKVACVSDACAPVLVLPLDKMPALALPARLDEWLVVCCEAQLLEQRELSAILLMRSRGARAALLERPLREPRISLLALESVSFGASFAMRALCAAPIWLEPVEPADIGAAAAPTAAATPPTGGERRAFASLRHAYDESVRMHAAALTAPTTNAATDRATLRFRTAEEGAEGEMGIDAFDAGGDNDNVENTFYIYSFSLPSERRGQHVFSNFCRFLAAKHARIVILAVSSPELDAILQVWRLEGRSWRYQGGDYVWGA